MASKGLTVEVNGIEKVEAELAKKFSKEALDKITDRALIAGAQVIKAELRKNFELFKDTGASRDEITISKPMILNGVKSIIIYWSGPKNRWHIIHMNEFGTVKNPNPRGKGAIERSIKSGKKEYLRVVAAEIGRSI